MVDDECNFISINGFGIEGTNGIYTGIHMLVGVYFSILEGNHGIGYFAGTREKVIPFDPVERE